MGHGYQEASLAVEVKENPKRHLSQASMLLKALTLFPVLCLLPGLASLPSLEVVRSYVGLAELL